MVDPVEPVTLAMAKKRLRLGTDITRDDEVAQAISAARAHVEQFTGLVLTGPRQVTQSLEQMTHPRLAGTRVRLAAWPVISLVSVEYDPADGGVPLAIAGARVLSSERPARLAPAVGEAFPVLGPDQRGRVTVMAGHPVEGEGADARAVIPDDLVMSILLMTRHLFDNPSGVITGTIATELPLGVMALARPHRL